MAQTVVPLEWRRPDGGLQVRHDDRASKLTHRVGQNCFESGTVAEMQVPIVRSGDGKLLHPFIIKQQ